MSRFRSLRVFVVVAAFATGACSSSSTAIADAPLTSCAPASEGQNATTEAISSMLSRTKEQDNLRAIIFGAERNGKPILRTALGMSTPGVPATTAMHFRVGFVGWQYLTDVLLLMTERKQIALTDSVSKWFPEYPHAGAATVRMLAASSTGFGDYIRPSSFTKAVTDDPRRVWTARDLITRSLPPYQTPAFTRPGKDWAYSHTDFVMLGAILERAGGKPFTSLLKEMILDPLALRDTQLQFDTKPRLPVLHTLDDGTYEDSTFWNPSFVSWASMTSNVCDLGIWNRAFGTSSLLPRALKSQVTAPVNVGLGPNTANSYFGLGTIVRVPWIVANAAYWGMYTSTAYDPTTGISLEVTVSLNPGAAPKNPSAELLSAISKLLTPHHPIPN
jgi:CubicO group peptidase (beta-lactamase class C family)